MIEVNLTQKIEKAVWTAEALILDAEELIERAGHLTVEERKSLPKFSALWKEKEIRSYLERLSEALKQPRIFHSRKLLEEAGFASDSISTDVLENTGEIKKVTTLLRELKEMSDLLQVMSDSRVLSRWLNDSITTTITKLELIIEAKEGFKRLVNLENIPKQIRKEFLEVALETPATIQQIEQLDSQIVYLKAYGINLRYKGEGLSEYTEACKATYEKLLQLEDTYKLPKVEIQKETKGKSLLEATALLEKRLERTERDYNDLKRQWHELGQTLHSLGQEIPELPKGIPSIKKVIIELEQKCRANLGESGQELLNFLRGRGDFPERLTKVQIKEALEKLRPFIVKSIGGAEWLE